jgi:short-subunit dehydrogenase
MKASILILGATSAIAKGCAHSFAKLGYPLYLAGRNEKELDRMAADIKIRWQVPVICGYLDACDFESHEPFFNRVITEMPGLHGVLLAFGYMGDNQKAAENFEEAKMVIDINYTAACSILTPIAKFLEKKRNGWIIAISSPAGDRGRQSNYVYGSSKAGLDCYLAGLRNRLYSSGISVITIKPGFVDTSMTFGKKGIFLVADPNEIGEKITHTINGWRDTVYLPGFWRYILWVVCLIPEFIFKRLKI